MNNYQTMGLSINYKYNFYGYNYNFCLSDQTNIKDKILRNQIFF